MNSAPAPTLNANTLRWLVIIAAVSYAPALAFYYVGEEAIFPIASLEMWFRDSWIQHYIYGSNERHTPLFNWLIMSFAPLVGWQYMLPVARAIAIGATLGTAAIVGWLALRLLRDRALAWFAALVYLTLADIALYRGWLAYVDPLFAMFIFGSIAALWVACAEERPALLAAAVVSLSCAFLSKALTAYVFYATAAFVLLFTQSGRRVLFGPVSLAMHALALLALFGWLQWVPGNPGQGGRMFGEIISKLLPASPLQYLQHLIGFPAEALVRMSPALPLAAYYMLRKRISLKAEPVLAIAAAIAFLSFLPYWLAPRGAIRYLLPMYPMAAFAAAILLWRAGAPALASARRWLAGVIVVKIVVFTLVFPWYQSHYRGENYAIAARDIIALTAGYPLYAYDSSASGLSVIGYIDAFAWPAPPLQQPPQQWDSGFVIARPEDAALGRPFKQYPLAADTLYIYCRGAACDVAH